MSRYQAYQSLELLNYLDRRKFTGGSIAAAFSLKLASPAFAVETPKEGGHLKVGLTGGSRNDSLDPTLANAKVIGHILGQCCERLVYPTRDGHHLEARLAQTWDHSPDFQTWNFHLRRDVAFHTGKQMTAGDVVFSLNRHRSSDSRSGAAGLLGIIASIETDGDYRIIVRLKHPSVDFPFSLTDYHLVIQPEHTSGDIAVGTGPYALTENKHGIQYTTEKFASYWQQNVGFVQSIETLVMNDDSVRVSALLDGEVHLINRIDPKMVSSIAGTSSARVVPAEGRGHYVFAMRTDTAPFDNPDLRMALKLAIDRDAMVKQVLYGYGSVGNDTPINASYPLAIEFTQRSYDPVEAAHFYKKSGHRDAIKLRTSEVAFGGAVDAAMLFKEQAAKAGIKIDVQIDPGDSYWHDVWNSVPFCASFWDGRPTQHNMFSLAYRSDAPWNETAWKRSAFDDLLADADREIDPMKRTELYKTASAMIRDDGGAIIPMFTQYLDGVSSKVKGYVIDVNNELSNARFQETCWLS